MKKKMKVVTIIFTMLICSAGFTQVTKASSTRQISQSKEITDAELKKFAQAYQGIQLANQEAQKEMIAAVEEQDLDVGTFNKIHQAKLDNQDIYASKEDIQKHKRAVEKIEKMQPEIQANIEDVINSEGLTVDRYQEIAQAIQNDQKLQQRFQKVIMG